jgi:hypothetical protein
MASVADGVIVVGGEADEDSTYDGIGIICTLKRFAFDSSR